MSLDNLCQCSNFYMTHRAMLFLRESATACNSNRNTNFVNRSQVLKSSDKLDKSDYAHTIIQHSYCPLLIYIYTCAFVSPVGTQPHHLTTFHANLGDKPPEHGRAVLKNTRISKNFRVTLNHVSSLLHIVRALTRSLHRDPSAAEGHIHAIHPHDTGLPRARPVPVLTGDERWQVTLVVCRQLGGAQTLRCLIN